jgi:hypothetical protein
MVATDEALRAHLAASLPEAAAVMAQADWGGAELDLRSWTAESMSLFRRAAVAGFRAARKADNEWRRSAPLSRRWTDLLRWVREDPRIRPCAKPLAAVIAADYVHQVESFLAGRKAARAFARQFASSYSADMIYQPRGVDLLDDLANACWMYAHAPWEGVTEQELREVSLRTLEVLRGL